METINAIEITWVTCVGVGNIKKFPISSGNCFSVQTEGGEPYRIVNFVHENMREALRRGLEWPVKIKQIGKGNAIIHDERIPDHWYQNRYCEVCCPSDLLPFPQRMAHDRATARGDRKDLGNGMIQVRMGSKSTMQALNEP